MRQISWLFRRENKRQKSTLWQQIKTFFSRSSAIVLIVLLTLIGLHIWKLVPENVKALDFGEKAVAANWRGTSFPVENFQRYSSPFGYRWHPDGASGWGFHRGLDLAAPEGSYVRSWYRGEVAEVGNDRLCGTKVIIRSGDWQHIYCHLKGRAETSLQGRYLSDRDGGILLWQGQQVQAGDRIGRVGMTGRTTGPHLHWGLKYTNQYVDPALVLQAMYAQQSGFGSFSNRR